MANNDDRGLASASDDTRQSVASQGGQASHGGGRGRQNDDSSGQGSNSGSKGGRSGGKSKRGFASMSSEEQRKIASKGGKAAHDRGTAHEWTSEEARAAGRKGGQS